MYSENQAIQKKRDDVQTSALKWIINNLKTLQNNIININYLLTPRIFTFQFTFESASAGTDLYSGINYIDIDSLDDIPIYYINTTPEAPNGRLYDDNVTGVIRGQFMVYYKPTAAETQTLIQFINQDMDIRHFRLYPQGDGAPSFDFNYVSYHKVTDRIHLYLDKLFTSGVLTSNTAYSVLIRPKEFIGLLLPIHPLYIKGGTQDPRSKTYTLEITYYPMSKP